MSGILVEGARVAFRVVTLALLEGWSLAPSIAERCYQLDNVRHNVYSVLDGRRHIPGTEGPTPPHSFLMVLSEHCLELVTAPRGGNF